MDKNQILGLVLIAIIILGYGFYQSSQVPEGEIEKQQQEENVSTETADADDTPSTNKEKQEEKANIEASEDTSRSTQKQIEEKRYTIENEDMVIVFSNRGGKIDLLELKKHNSFDATPVVLKDDIHDIFHWRSGNYILNDDDKSFTTTLNNKTTSLQNGDTLSFDFVHTDGSKEIIQRYTIYGEGYEVGYGLQLKGFDKSSFKTVTIDWRKDMLRLEENLEYSRQKSGINYYTKDGSFDDMGEGESAEEENTDEPLKWFSLRQRFFNTGIIADGSFTNNRFKTTVNAKENSIVKRAHAIAETDLTENGNNLSGQFKLYYGPNDYSITKKVTEGYEENVYLGWAVFSYINKWIVIPIFNVLERYISNYGVIILILVFIIKLLLFPIAYKSYLSMAKMKELKPEIDAIKEEHGSDMQKVQQEQMKLYQKVGVNPVSGCIPMILQMPVLLALFNFFPNAIQLRQKAFLWAHDLSTYDALISWETPILLIGNHISIFTLLMTISTVAYTYYNNQINSAAQGPMKAVGYIMPVFFFFFLNDFAAGLTFYYFVSNLLTITQQLVASNFIDKDKIRQKMEENKKNFKGKKKSTFQQRLEESFKAQQEKKKPGKKKK